MTLKRPVTLPQARRWPAAAKRRQSFCARMGGMRDRLTGDEAASDPGSPINRALVAWDCDRPALLQRKHVSKGIRMKITTSKVGSETRKATAKAPARKRSKNPEMVRKIGKFNVRYVPGGRDSKVEFYDSRYTGGRFGEMGQFVTRYFARDILESPMGPLSLDLGIPEWSITAAEKEKVREMIARSGDFGPVLNPAKPRRRPGVVRKVNEAINRMAARNPARESMLYVVHVADSQGKPAYDIAKFRKRVDALQYARAYADANRVRVVLISRPL